MVLQEYNLAVAVLMERYGVVLQEYYLANQLKNPIVSLLEPLYDNTDDLFAAGERKLKNKSAPPPEIAPTTDAICPEIQCKRPQSAPKARSCADLV